MLMAVGKLNRVLHYLRHMVAPQAERPTSDGELLRRFTRQHDEAAFAEVVRRHGPLVLGVCRRVLGNAPEAEQAFQATFVILARKGGSVRREALASWLYRVAFQTARSAQERRASAVA
jgi:DNA-directed RNA polymerase specialized sigma24 family protein